MKCIIIDDEPIAREGMEMLIAEFPELNLVGSFSNAQAASGFLEQNPADLIFLDIHMPGQNGMEFAKSLSSDMMIIFTTAYRDYAADSYALDAIDYLVKPIESSRFAKAVEKAVVYRKLVHSNKVPVSIETVETSFIFIKADRKFHKIWFKDILYIEGLKDYVILHLPSKKIMTAMNIKTIFQKLPPVIFARINKSFIVNVDHMDSADTHSVYIGETEIAIGATYKESFLQEYIYKKTIIKV